MTFSTELLNNGWIKPKLETEKRIRRYSTTGDILSYKRCPRQYGFFSVRGFSSATATQRYFGTLMHDVLDQLNREYQLNPAIPSIDRIQEVIDDAHDRLYRSGIRSYGMQQQKEDVTNLIKRFVESVGPHFFKHVKQTEYRLERALSTENNLDYILDGIVDVLTGAVSHDLGLPYSTDPEDIEIWDYKSGKIPDKGSSVLKDYEYQMRVYLELFQRQAGYYPARAVLVFVGELGDDKRWNISNSDPTFFPKLFYVVTPNPSHIKTAIDEFHKTVDIIEAELAKPYIGQWQPPPPNKTDPQTCEACELRYNCNGFPSGQKQKTEPL